MSITQTVEIPADRRLNIVVPSEVPTGPVILSFTAVPSKRKPRMTEAEELEYINKNADRLNAEALDVLSYQVSLWGDEES